MRWWFFRALLGLAVVVCAGTADAVAETGQVEPQYFFPAGGQRGTERKIQSKGEMPRWPMQVWCATPGIHWQPTEEKGTWSVSIDAHAAPGLHWIRVFDPQGASAIFPFLVDGIPQCVAEEPDNRWSDTKRLAMPVVADGRLEQKGDVDSFRVFLEKGETLVAQLVANRYLNTPMDGVLQVVLPNGIVVEQLDDARGLDPLLTWVAPAAGEYGVRVFGFPSKPNSSIQFTGGDDIRYRLYLTVGAFLDYSRPLCLAWGNSDPVRAVGWNLPPDTMAEVVPCPFIPDRANAFVANGTGFVRLPRLASHIADESTRALTLPAFVTGAIRMPRESDVFEFDGKSGEAVAMELWSDRIGASLDAQLTVDAVLPPEAAADQAWTQAQDDSQQKDPVLSVVLPRDGKYRVTVKDLYGQAGERHYYGLHVRHNLPDFRLTVEHDHWFMVTTGEVAIPVALERVAFTESIVVTCDGLPTGIVVEPVWSVMGTETEKSVTLKLRGSPAAGVWSGPMRIVSHAEGGRDRVATWLIPGGPETSSGFWLTVGTP